MKVFDFYMVYSYCSMLLILYSYFIILLLFSYNNMCVIVLEKKKY